MIKAVDVLETNHNESHVDETRQWFEAVVQEIKSRPGQWFEVWRGPLRDSLGLVKFQFLNNWRNRGENLSFEVRYPESGTRVLYLKADW